MSKAAPGDVQNTQLLHLVAADLAWQWSAEAPAYQFHVVLGALTGDSEALSEQNPVGSPNDTQ